MYTNIEFLGLEPIENVITCMRYKMDRTVFFGYPETIYEMKKQTERFLKKYCSVKEVLFVPVSKNELQQNMQSIKNVVEKERKEGNRLYFDITGGESLILVAFGMLAKELAVPMHVFDIKRDKLIELNPELQETIRLTGIAQDIKMDLHKFIEMRGGIINYRMQKDIKGESMLTEQKIQDIWAVSKKHDSCWNAFSAFVRKVFRPDAALYVSVNSKTVIKELQNHSSHLNTVSDLNQILDDLEQIHMITNLQHSDGKYAFRYTSEEMQDILWDSGSILELYTFMKESKKSDDCKIGVHLDWDGEIHEKPGVDVVNEIDVITLNGNIPTFISCKNGRLDSSQALYALYELDAVVRHFGGKYAKKVLAISKPMANVYQNRARDMEIEIRVEDSNSQA